MRLELDIRFLSRSGVDLTVDDLRLGLSLGIVKPTTVVALAKRADLESPVDPIIQELSELDGSAIADIREILGVGEQATLQPELSVRKWLYLELLATYELRENLKDPFEFVELIYADFGYPESVAPFVRYMPLEEGASSGLAAMTESWRQYLTSEAEALVCSREDRPGDPVEER